MLPTGMRVIVCTVRQDMRKSFDTLATVAASPDLKNVEKHLREHQKYPATRAEAE